MLPSELPICPVCHGRDYTQGGGHVSPMFSAQTFSCGGCQTFVQFLGHRAGAILAFIARDACADEGDDLYRFPETYTEWIRTSLLPTWGDRAARLDEHKALEWRKWLSEVFYVAHPELHGQTDDRGNVYFDDTHISYHHCPPEAQALYNDMWGQGRAPEPGTYLPLPPDLAQPVYPPQIPALKGMILMFRGFGTWHVVDPRVSRDLEVPEDPILVRNRQFFEDVWKGVAAGLERDMPPVTETTNLYGGIEPWFTFKLGTVAFVVGWRKRVVAIHVTAEIGIETRGIRALAMADDVTYSAYGPLITRTADDVKALLSADPGVDEILQRDTLAIWKQMHPNGQITRDGGWKDARPVAHQIEVHAWTLEKTIEYLTTLCRAALVAEEAA